MRIVSWSKPSNNCNRNCTSRQSIFRTCPSSLPLPTWPSTRTPWKWTSPIKKSGTRSSWSWPLLSRSSRCFWTGTSWAMAAWAWSWTTWRTSRSCCWILIISMSLPSADCLDSKIWRSFSSTTIYSATNAYNTSGSCQILQNCLSRRTNSRMLAWTTCQLWQIWVTWISATIRWRTKRQK